MGFYGRQWIHLESGGYPSTRQGRSTGAKPGFQVKKATTTTRRTGHGNPAADGANNQSTNGIKEFSA
jgi:hypothetical protein